jgi:hypothetical protein
MYDAFSSGSGLKGRRSFKKGKEGAPISASRGVRQGRVADTEKAPVKGVPSRRRARRIPTSLRLKVGEGWRRVAADISAGGALLLLPERLEDATVTLAIELKDGTGKWEAQADVIRRERRGDRIAHHVHFTQPQKLAGLAEAIERCFAEGRERLLTV